MSDLIAWVEVMCFDSRSFVFLRCSSSILKIRPFEGRSYDSFHCLLVWRSFAYPSCLLSSARDGAPMTKGFGSSLGSTGMECALASASSLENEPQTAPRTFAVLPSDMRIAWVPAMAVAPPMVNCCTMGLRCHLVASM